MQNLHCLLGLVIEEGTLLWCSTHEQGRAGRLWGRYWERHLAGTKGVRGCSRGSQTGAGSQCGGGGRPNVAEIGSTWTLLPRSRLRWALKVHCACLWVALRCFDENISIGWFLFSKISETPIVHVPKLFPLLHWFQNTFCFLSSSTPSHVGNFFQISKWVFFAILGVPKMALRVPERKGKVLEQKQK